MPLNRNGKKRDVYLGCTDTPFWDDRISHLGDCPLYRQKHCRNNSPGTLAGAAFNFPEINCCGCGKCDRGKI